MFTLRRPAVYVPLAVAVLAFVVGAMALASGSGGSLLRAGRANCPPVARNDAAFTAPNAPVRVDVLANDSDVDGDRLEFQVISVSAGAAEVDFAGAGAQTLVYTPATPDGSRATVKYRVRDPSGDVSTAVATIAVTTAGALPAGLESAALTDANGEAIEARCLKLAKRPAPTTTATTTLPGGSDRVASDTYTPGTQKPGSSPTSSAVTPRDVVVNSGDDPSPSSGNNEAPPPTHPSTTHPFTTSTSVRHTPTTEDDSTDTPRTTTTTDPCDGDEGCPDGG